MAARKKSRGKRGRVDWRKARRLYEINGKSFTEIGETLGCRRETVARHAKSQAWINSAEIARESRAERSDEVFRRFIERDVDAITENLAQKHRVAKLILNGIEAHAERLEKGTLELVVRRDGKVLVDEDPIMAFRRLALALGSVEVVDRSLAGLKRDDAGWRPDIDGSAPDRSPHEEAVRRALDRAEGE